MSWEGRGKGTQVGGINNQDSIIASSLENSILFGVFDGHGEYGGEASSYLIQTLPTNVLELEEQILEADMDPAKALSPFAAAYAKTHRQLLDQTEQKGFDTFLSGSTCITVLVAGVPGKRRLVIANAGDCRAIIATEGWGGKSVTSQLSVDQTPDRPDERKRIESLGGIVGMVNPNLNPMAVLSPEETAELGIDLGPVRVFWPDGSFEPPYESCFPGLAMSRSMGDSCLGTPSPTHSSSLRTSPRPRPPALSPVTSLHICTHTHIHLHPYVIPNS
jgi:serine/threonine protein phosphatase PrpC